MKMKVSNISVFLKNKKKTAIFQLVLLFLVAASVLTLANFIKPDSDNSNKLVLENGSTKYTFHIEIARTDEETTKGLMYRTEVPRDSGMLFIFADESPRSFWMKNTLIPLDIIYFGKDGKFVSVAKNAQPCKQEEIWDCPTYSSEKPAQYVLETNAGRIDENHFNNELRIKDIDRYE